MARRTNYGFEKRQRELKKQKKKEAKAERRRLRKEGIDPDAPAEALADDPDAPEAGAEEGDTEDEVQV